MKPLPAWYSKPEVPSIRQGSLFREEFRCALIELEISTDQARRWHEAGLLSFPFELDSELEPYQVWELVNLRDLYRSGLCDFDIQVVLQKLPKPYQHDPERLAYSFSHGLVLADPYNEPDPSEVIEENIEEWLESLEVSALQSWKQRIIAKIADLEGNAS